jgi:CIC family chloride channel protein
MPRTRRRRFRLERLLTREYWLHEERSLVGTALTIGVLSGFAAALLVWMITGIGHALPLPGEGGRPPLWILFVPALGGLLVGPIVTRAAPETRGHGVPEVMLAVARKRGVIRARVAVLKAIASAISIGTGGSAGREGPIVQIGSAVGSVAGSVVRVSPDIRRMFVACGAAGGIAASFNTPIAGVIFALEVILRDFAGRAFATVVISSVTASVVSRTLLGQEAFFHVPRYTLHSHGELVLYAALGVVGALVARGFVLVLYRTEDFFDDLPLPATLKPALGGLLLGALGWFLPDVFGTGHHTIERALSGELALGLLVVLVGGKILATSFTLGSGGSGGVFAPSLFIGAMLGGGFGELTARLFPAWGVEPGAYALVGMGVVFAGGTWAAMSAILILFEMTRDYGLILPMMAACVTALLVAKRLSPDTIYTLKLRRRGIDLDAISDDPLRTISVESVMTTDVETIRSDAPLKDLVRQVKESDHSGFPVVDAAHRLEGIITYAELRDATAIIGDDTEFIIASDVMRTFRPAIDPRANLAEAVHKMRTAGVRRLPVVESAGDRTLLGILTNHDVISTLARVQADSPETAIPEV